jgi:two-component system, OmpR family, phosphate regulon sensor histidine kinase PhoR
MNRRRWVFRLIVAMIVVALLGLLGVQVYLLNSALELKEQTLRRNALGALNAVAQQLEAREAMQHMFTARSGVPMAGKKLTVTTQVNDFNTSAMRDSLASQVAFTMFPMPLRLSGDTVTYRVDRPQRVQLMVVDLASSRDSVIVDTFKTRGSYTATVNNVKVGSGFFYKYTADNSTFYLQVGKGTHGSVVSSPMSGKKKEALVSQVVDRLVVAEQTPIEERIESAALDSLLRSNLKDAGVPTTYAYGVVAEADSVAGLFEPANYAPQLRASDLRTRLFPADMFSPRHDLVLYFPTRGTFLMQQIGLQLAATIVFMLLIVVSFVYTLRTIVEQKRVAILMTDFINNMTHEFKTPISTVALAAEAIARPDVISRREKIRRYSGIIMEENARMRKQVDKILQMAVLEQGEYELHMAAMDAHDILTKAVEGITLQVEEKKGTVTCSFEARSSVIQADPLHFSNVIHNLLDNANKYSPEVPRILVSTHEVDGKLVIRITDNGLGIRTEDLSKVFDRYYRVPTGNVHDVKGFGMGLSYVKLLVTAMGGEVGISSTFGEGTTAEVKMRLESEEGRLKSEK